MSDGYFSHGGEYKKADGIQRDKCCATCAFKAGPGTVRPEGVTIADVWAETEDCFDFVCHTPGPDGWHPSCPGWHAMKADQAPAGRAALSREEGR